MPFISLRSSLAIRRQKSSNEKVLGTRTRSATHLLKNFRVIFVASMCDVLEVSFITMLIRHCSRGAVPSRVLAAVASSPLSEYTSRAEQFRDLAAMLYRLRR